MHSHTNHLISETSPYLLQHAHNPVNWYPWTNEALRLAKDSNRPILVSIGYAACHWCHVMERESFENEDTARIMNENFINIKIDREERPDLDHIYMDAVQAMTGSGGWPLNVFLTPGGKPFYGGTYFPPSRAFNRPSWTEILQSVSQAFKERRHEIDAQAENLTAHLLQSNSFGLQKPGDEDAIFSKEKLRETFDNLMKTADREWGGFGRAPKFPQTFSIQFLLRYYYVNNFQIPPPGPLQGQGWGEAAFLSLDKMIEGGIYDQVGGGFARYSTDIEWLAPHFEKMLYDNALLISVLSEAYQLTKQERYKEVIDETMAFVKRELLHPDGGFYSALDADSEGEEGKFYVWSVDEVRRVLGENAELFCRYYDITEKGNWEGKNILRVKTPLEKFVEENGISTGEMKRVLQDGRARLLEERAKRIRPQLDDKIILSWNALMNTACSKAFMATGREEYRQLAIDNMQFLLRNFSKDNTGEFHHTWKGGPKYPAFLDDYAFLIQALIHLQEITSEGAWLTRARDLTQYVIDHFDEEGTGFFYFTIDGQEDVIVRKKEVYDGALPSGNSVMAYNLLQLSVIFDKSDWRKRSHDMVASLALAVVRYPTSFGIWACLLQELLDETLEIAIIGKGHEQLREKLFEHYLPHRVLQTSAIEDHQFALLNRKTSREKPMIFLCKDFVCQQPVDTIQRFMSLIDRAKKVN